MLVANNAFRTTLLYLAGTASLILLVPLLVVFVIIGLSWWIAIPVALIFGFGLTFLWAKGASGRVANQLGISDANLCDDPGLSSLVEGLSLSIGIEEPSLHIVQDDSTNALSIDGPDGASILVTSGLLRALGRVELEGVVAELLVPIKNEDAELAAAAAGSFGALFLDGPLSGFASPVGAWAMRRVIEPDGGFAADRDAVGVTRYPPGLSSALVKISESFTPALATAGNDHLWVAPPLMTEAAVSHSPLQWRIDNLLEL